MAPQDDGFPFLKHQLRGLEQQPVGNHFQLYRVAEDVLLHSALVFSTVIDCGFKRVFGPDLAPERAPIVEPLGRIVPRVVGPFALQCHTVFLEHLDPWGLKFHHGLREIRMCPSNKI